MAGETIITIVGNLTADPDLRFTQNGIPVASFTVASTPTRYDKEQGKFVDGDPLFLRCNVWRDLAENVAETLTRGMRVIAQGRLKQTSWEKDGQKHTGYELDVDEVGPSLRWATAAVSKRTKGQASQAPHPAQREQSSGWGQQPAAPAADPWGGVPPTDEEPPF